MNLEIVQTESKRAVLAYVDYVFYIPQLDGHILTLDELSKILEHNETAENIEHTTSGKLQAFCCAGTPTVTVRFDAQSAFIMDFNTVVRIVADITPITSTVNAPSGETKIKIAQLIDEQATSENAEAWFNTTEEMQFEFALKCLACDQIEASDTEQYHAAEKLEKRFMDLLGDKISQRYYLNFYAVADSINLPDSVYVEGSKYTAIMAAKNILAQDLEEAGEIEIYRTNEDGDPVKVVGSVLTPVYNNGIYFIKHNEGALL